MSMRPNTDWRPRTAAGGIDALAPWLIAGLAIAALHFGKSVLIPIILAVLISFLLAPIVALVRRLGIPHVARSPKAAEEGEFVGDLEARVAHRERGEATWHASHWLT